MLSFAERAVDGVRRQMRHHARTIECSDVVKRVIKNCRSDDDALEFLGSMANTNLHVTQAWNQQHPQSSAPAEGYIEDQYVRMLSRLFSRHITGPQLCLQVDDRAVEEFGGANMTASVAARAIDLLLGQSLVYIDVRDRAWEIAGVHVQMVFIENFNGNERYLAVVELPAGGLRLIQWCVVDEMPQSFRFDHFHRVDDSLIALFRMRASGLNSLQNEIKRLGIDQLMLASEIVQLCRLSVVWVDVQRDAPESPTHYLVGPSVGNGAIRLRPNGRPMQMQQRIRFAYVQPHRQRHRGAGNGHRRELTRLHRVKGHFRLQRHGTGFREEKMIWIDEFVRGPRDGQMQLAGFRLNPLATQAHEEVQL